MSANPFTAPRPTWEEIIDPLADSALWPQIRTAASKLLSLELEGTGFGISSSDVNHQVFGVAAWIERGDGYAGRVLSHLLEEIEWKS